MPHIRRPRKGTLQFWPRKRAKRTFARVRAFPTTKEVKPLAFAGYKVGMTHVIITDNKPTSLTKGQDISMPITVIECPPLKSASIVFYKKTSTGLKTSSAVQAPKLDKELSRRIRLNPSKKKLEDFNPEDYDDIRLLVYTQPKLTTIGKKKPELFEIQLSGKNTTEKLELAKSLLGKEITINDVLNEGQLVDVHAITKGKGVQGPTKRFGTSLRARKSEKGIRGPGNIGPWTGARLWRVAFAGQTGYHQRMEHNKWLIKIGDKPEEVNKIAGFKRYGIVKNNYILLKGSIQGPSKRLIIFTNPLRPLKNLPKEAPTIQFIRK